MLAGLATIPLMFFVSASVASFITLCFSFLQVGASFWMSYTLGTKRINDIGNNVEMTKKIFYGILGLWASVYLISQIGSIFNIEILFKLLPFVTPILIINVILSLYMLCMPGKSGDNELGKDPMNTKLGFFG